MRRFFIDKSALSYRIRARAEDRNWRGPFAEVAELVDALGSGPSGGNTVGVRVPSSAPFRRNRILACLRVAQVPEPRISQAANVLPVPGIPSPARSESPPEGSAAFVFCGAFRLRRTVPFVGGGFRNRSHDPPSLSRLGSIPDLGAPHTLSGLPRRGLQGRRPQVSQPARRQDRARVQPERL